MVAFGSGSGFATRSDPALTISIGDAAGAIWVCQPDCARAVPSTLDDLDMALTSTPSSPGPIPLEIHGDIRLGGEAGRWERPGYRQRSRHGNLGIGVNRGGTCLGCPQMRYQAYTFHDGRPLVVTFDYWNIAFGRIPLDDAARMIESFRFLD